MAFARPPPRSVAAAPVIAAPPLKPQPRPRRRPRVCRAAPHPPPSPPPLGTRLGAVTIRPVAPVDAGAVAVLLARSFAGRAALRDAAAFVEGAAAAGGGGDGATPVVLVADLVPDDPALLPPSRSSRVAGVVAAALTDAAVAAAAPDEPRPPPGGGALIFSLAVDPRCRRAGVATLLLDAAEGVVADRCRGSGGNPSAPATAWLVADGGAGADAAALLQMYQARGYVRVEEGGGGLFGGLFGRKGGGVLMRKEV